MVRINLINPEKLADQHLIAEYNEILMLLGHAKKFPETKTIPKSFVLGKGHIKFFKNKLLYLKKRHAKIKKEMKKRGFKTQKTINLKDFDSGLHNDWNPAQKDKQAIKQRLLQKLKLKPEFYTYYRKKKNTEFFIELLNK